VVLYFLKKLSFVSYYVTLDNLFVLNKLLEVLCFKGFIVIGACQRNASVISELINIKKNNKGLDKLLWGTFILMFIILGLMCQIG
jgi:hypothetical protein